MFRLAVIFAILAVAVAFSPVAMRSNRVRVEMKVENLQSKISRALGVAAMGVALAGPVPAMADGAVSKSTVYRARNSYGARIVDLQDAADKANFAAFEDKKALNAFDLFISGANALNSAKDKENKKAELNLQKELYAAVKAKDASKLRAAYNNFIKVADLKSEFQLGERGQTDSSGFSPTYGTSRQYIYQR